MRRRAAIIAMVVGSLVSSSCRSQESDPFVDLSAGDESASTVGGGVPAAPAGTGASRPVSTPAQPASTAAAPVPSAAASSMAPSATAEDPTRSASSLDLASAAFGETVDSSVACLADPATCDPSVVAVPGGPAHERYARLVAVFHERGYVVRRAEGLSHWVVESADPGQSADVLMAVVCDVDADEVVEPADRSGLGLDVVVNDEMVARRVGVELRRTPGGWRRWSVEQLGEWPMESQCPPV